MLKRGGVIKVKDIAAELEVSEKQVRRYKEELEEYFDIEAVSGPAGGYRLRDTYFPFKDILNDDEIDMLKYSIGLLEDIPLENRNIINSAIRKINYSIFSQSNYDNDYIIPYARNDEVKKFSKKMIDEIYDAIINHLEIEITYEDNHGEKSQRVVQPYKFIIYKGERYLVSYCKMRCGIRYFKVKRIESYKVTTEKFERTIDISKVLEEHKENRFGIYGGNSFNIDLTIKSPLAKSIKEKIWVENQKVILNEDNSIRFVAEMQESPELISWILSMGDYVYINGPEELREKIKNKLENMMKNLS